MLHGIPDTPVDVYVNGDLTLDDFQPGDLAGPLELPAGDYEVALTAPDAADASSPVLGPATLTLAAGKNYTAVAHLNEDGEPALKAFENNTATTAAGQGRLTVRHVAAAPAVDILAGGAPVIEDLTNPNESTLDLPASTVSAAVALAGTTDPVLGPTDVADPGRRPHDRVRLGQRRGRQPRARRADDHGPALEPGRRAVRHSRLPRPA